MVKSRIIDKIKKCLALGRSANEHEAAAALRQAQKLMELYNVKSSEIEISDISESTVEATVKRTPPLWENNLMYEIANAFGCEVIFGVSVFFRADWIFIGGQSEVEVAQYAADVLLRQVRAARRRYIDAELGRCKPKTKTARADTFCLGWVYQACKLLEKYPRHAALEKYMAQKYSAGMADLSTRDRTNAAGNRGLDDFYAGGVAGKSAQLHDGVGGVESRKMIGV